MLMKTMKLTKKVGDITLSTSPNLIDLHVIYTFLKEDSYWGKERTFEQVKTAVENSFPIVILKEGKQIGFARIVTDFCFFGYLADVFIQPEHQGNGYGKALMQFIMEIPFVPHLRWFCLATRDAHGLYKQYGFTPPQHQEMWMEIRNAKTPVQLEQNQ